MIVLAPGKVIGGRYRLEREVGRGGMGVVWRATHIGLSQPVAVKFVLTPVMREDVIARFMREARTAAAVRHVNVVSVLDVGLEEGVLPYLAMEWLDGKPLDAWLATDPRPSVAELLRALADVLVGLDAVHGAQIVHRDLKPANVFMVEERGRLLPKIVDFGVSRIDTAEPGDQRLTESGQILGTPLYMAPEQLRGGRNADARSDLYSIGVMLFEGIAGRPPFVAESFTELIVEIATAEPADIDQLRPDLPRALRDVVRRAIARDATKRFQSAREMRDALLPLAAQLEAAALGPAVGTAATLPATPSSLAVDSAASPRRARGRAWQGVAGLVGIVALVAIGWAASGLLADPDTRTGEELDAAAPTAIGSPPDPAPPSAAPDPAPAPVTLRVSGVPASAIVTLDGETITLPWHGATSDVERAVRIQADGRTLDQVVRLDRDVTLTWPAAAPEEPAGPPARGGRGARPEHAASASSASDPERDAPEAAEEAPPAPESIPNPYLGGERESSPLRAGQMADDPGF